MSNNPQTGDSTRTERSLPPISGLTVSRDPEPTTAESADVPARPCVICDKGVGDTTVTDTANRALVTVNTRTHIEPVCETHDTQPVTVSIRRILNTGGMKFLAEAITAGVVSESDATDFLSPAQQTQLADLLNI